jgi:preprotein translocase subunit YajC
MNFASVSGLIALAPSAPGTSSAPAWTGVLPLVLMIVVFYFLLIRPQQKKQKEHEKLIKTLHAGDKIVTNGGLVGVVITVKETTVNIRSNDSKLEIQKAAVAQVTERGGEGSAA